MIKKVLLSLGVSVLLLLVCQTPVSAIVVPQSHILNTQSNIYNNDYTILTSETIKGVCEKLIANTPLAQVSFVANALRNDNTVSNALVNAVFNEISDPFFDRNVWKRLSDPSSLEHTGFNMDTKWMQDLDTVTNIKLVESKIRWQLFGPVQLVESLELKTDLNRVEGRSSLKVSLNIPVNNGLLFYDYDQSNSHKIGIIKRV